MASVDALAVCIAALKLTYHDSSIFALSEKCLDYKKIELHYSIFNRLPDHALATPNTLLLSACLHH
eukprot:3559520-Amphidinium_carterae.2